VRWLTTVTASTAIVCLTCCASSDGDAQGGGAVGCSTTTDQSSEAAPEWASTNGAPQSLGFVASESGRLLAYSFARPLLADPPPEGPLNKVLIVTDEPTDGLSIVASIDGHRQPDKFRTNSNGRATWFPGYLDVTDVGCWRFDVSYNDQIETLFLHYS
jgi:hypothetical protein